jgi:tetratricopeptide (TPR) repeat protein
MRRSREWLGLFAASAFSLCIAASAAAQVVSPLTPMAGKDGPRAEPTVESPPNGQGVVIPLPQAANRVEAADRARIRVTAALPASWTSVSTRYQPYWSGVQPVGAFGIDSWSPWFAASGIMPVLSPHPFFSPWGLLSYDGWMYDRYRAIWGAASSPDEGPDAALWLQRGDRAMLENRPREAAQAYRRLTQIAPDLPLGYFGLGISLAELGEDDDAAASLRQAIDRYPGWLPPSVDWTLLVGDDARMARLRAATAGRAERGDTASVFVAGVMSLYGGEPSAGRAYLTAILPDEHARILLSRSESSGR